MKTVQEVMTADTETCTTLDNVYEVAVKMKEWNVGAIPIVDRDQLVGMITDRDLVIKASQKRSQIQVK